MGPPHKITTVDGGELEADNVVVATHLPFLDRTGHFTVAEPSRSYAIAASLTDDTKMINGMRSLIISLCSNTSPSLISRTVTSTRHVHLCDQAPLAVAEAL